MAIEYARVVILNAVDHSVVAKAAYNAREKAYDQTRGIAYDFRFHDGLIDSGFVLPADAPEWAASTEALWNAAQDRECVKDRKTGETRLSKHGKPQVAKDITLALPRELDDDQNRQLLHAFIAAKYSPSNVAVQWAIHRDGDNHNPHAHLIVSTRQLSGKGFGKKARELNPDFIRGQIQNDHFAREWTAFQNAFFAERGMELRVDPTRIVPSRHLGNARFVPESRREDQNGALAEKAKETARDPAKVLAHAVKNAATFTARDIGRHLKKAGLDEVEQQEISGRIMASPELISLGKGRYTTRAVIEQERAVLAGAQRMAQGGGRGVSAASRETAATSRTMSAEQRAVYDYATGAERLAVVQGRAGTGKSYTMGAIREAYERDGYRVIGLAPTNTVAADMRSDGFVEGRTVAAELLRQENDKVAWNARTVIMVDEMGMLSTDDMERLLVRAEAAGAKVIGFGDDRQLQSVARGGMFSHIAQVARARELATVLRQKVEYQNKASVAAARGDMQTAIAAYSERGDINWSSDLDEAQNDLVRDWHESVQRQPAELPFVYAATNAAVASLNDRLRAIRQALGHLRGDEHVFTTAKGNTSRETRVSVGDRVQFTKSVKDRVTKLDLRNGEFGVVEAIEGDMLTVRTDAGRVITYDAREHNGWDLGYASTVYKGQGKTQQHVLALHDSEFAWKAQLSYVALTRHKEAFRLYANRELAADEDELARKLAKSGNNRAAISYLADDRPSGRLVAHGRASYDHKPENRDSYFVTLEAAGREFTLWGVDLERAMAEASPQIGDQIGLEHIGSETVRLPDGAAAERNSWRVFNAAELGDTQGDTVRIDMEHVLRRWIDRGRAKLNELTNRAQKAMDAIRQRAGLPAAPEWWEDDAPAQPPAAEAGAAPVDWWEIDEPQAKPPADWWEPNDDATAGHDEMRSASNQSPPQAGQKVRQLSPESKVNDREQQAPTRSFPRFEP